VSLEERPDLEDAHDRLNGSAWPEFMLQDRTVWAYWGRLFSDFRRFQCSLLDPSGEPVAGLNSAPLAWDGTEDDLPAGWDQQILRTFGELDDGIAPDTLGAVQIVVREDRQGRGLAGTMVEAMKALALEQGFMALIACVRPTAKDQDPFADIGEYAFRVRDDGLPVDPWIRLHVRLGGRVIRGEPASMRMEGTIAEWRAWTGLPFPVSGLYAVPFAAAPVDIDLDADLGRYLDPNVWVVHWLV
jgi:GNAT superfamily N-acetyltransferase